MTLQHSNRMRKTSGDSAVRELQVAKADERDNSDPTDSEIRMRAYEIYLSRNGAPGNAEVDWLQAEMELRTRNSTSAPNES